MPDVFKWSPDIRSLLILIICWGGGILLVGPEGDFPLNDDWSYARGVASYLEDGTFELDTWPAMTLVGQIGIGILYGKIFGFSFTVLRWSTLINSLLCICLFYYLLRRFTTPPAALLSTLLLLFNPLYFSLSFTFMTEVHFLCFVVAGFFFLFRFLESGQYRDIILGSLACIVATLIRQPGILVALAAGSILWFGTESKKHRRFAALPFVSCLLVLLIYRWWITTYHTHLFRVGGATDLLHSVIHKDLVSLITTTFNLAMLSALSLLPLLFWLSPNVNRAGRHQKIVVGAAVTIIGSVMLYYLEVFPRGNVFYNLGLGPRVLKGYYADIIGNTEVSWYNALDFVALMATAGVALLLLVQVERIYSGFTTDKRVDTRSKQWCMVAVFCITYTIIAVLTPVNFDRHTLPLIPFLSVLIVPAVPPTLNRKWLPAAAMALTFIAFSLFSILATHDYLSWNRTRQEMYQYLTDKKGIDPSKIDGGFELNGWAKAGPEAMGGQSRYKNWFVTEDQYAIAFAPLEDYRVLSTRPIITWMSTTNDSLYLLYRPEE